MNQENPILSPTPKEAKEWEECYTIYKIEPRDEISKLRAENNLLKQKLQESEDKIQIYWQKMKNIQEIVRFTD